MKSAMKRVGLVLLLLIPSEIGFAQGCSNWMTPACLYTSSSMSGGRIYYSTTVSGTTNGTCPLGCGCSGVTHTPRAYTKIGSTGGWGSGTARPWNSYLSYTNTQSIPAQSTLVQVQTQVEVLCSVIGTLFATAVSTEYTATNPNCGGTDKKVVVLATPQTVRCDGATTYVASSGIGGSAEPFVTNVNVSTTTDNVLLIDLLGGPRNSLVCDNRPGGTSWCFDQSYKTAVPNTSTGRKGNVTWNYGIFCGLKQDPDISGPVSQRITCQ